MRGGGAEGAEGAVGVAERVPGCVDGGSRGGCEAKAGGARGGSVHCGGGGWEVRGREYGQA